MYKHINEVIFLKDYNMKKSLGFKLDRASRINTLNLSKNLKENGFLITPEQWGVINFLLQENGLTQSEIGKLINKDHTCVSRLIDNLIKKGLIKREVSVEDKRINLVYLTDEGKRLQKDVVGTVNASLDRAFQGISEEEKEIFSKVLDRIIENLE